MDVALKRWFDIISQFPEIHETVKQLHLLAGLAEQLRMLRDILSGKAPATLIKRANSMLKYIEKLREAKVQVPGDESFLYAYFCDLRNSGIALSRLRSIVEAIRFTEFVFGIEGLSQRLLSKRCIGASRRIGETVLKQSDPFTVEQLAILHGVLHDRTALFWDRLVSGAALVAVYTRSRWMDMQHTDTDEVVMDPDPNDPVFVELKIKEFKTKKANAWRGGIMAAVGPALGVVQGQLGQNLVGAQTTVGRSIWVGCTFDASTGWRRNSNGSTTQHRGVQQVGQNDPGQEWRSARGLQDFKPLMQGYFA